MQKIKYVASFFLLSLYFTFSYAKDHSIILTKETIQSLERCTSNKSVKLSCKSYHQTTSYTCGPAAVMTLMNYYGLLNSKNMNQQTELRIAGEMGATKDGTSSSQVAEWLRNQGLSVESGQRITTDKIIENIQKKIPVIIVFSNHWLLAKGYNKGSTPEEDEIIFADSCCNVTLISRKTIDSMWQESQMHNSYCRSNVGAYIIATKR